MLRRVRATLAALAFASTVAVVVVFGTVCSVDRAGLSSVDAAASAGGSSASGTGGTGGVRATGGNPGTGGLIVGTGGSGDQGTGGNDQGTGGVSNPGTGGGGVQGTGGATLGTGGASPGTGGSPPGTGGSPPGTGGSPGTGGASPGTGGASPGTGGKTGTSCASFPPGATSFVTPTDGMLHCYWPHMDDMGWNNAETTCENEGGTLATILSVGENEFVQGVAMGANLFQTYPMAVLPVTVSLGGTDGKTVYDTTGPGKYSWVTGEKWSYTNWHLPSEPDGLCNSCGPTGCVCDHRLTMAADGTWYDRPQTLTRPFVCEAVAR